MIAYVESNFVLELALLQEQHESGEAILALCEAGKVRLAIPAYSLAEPFDTLARRHRQRTLMKDELDRELRQLARTATLRQQLESFQDITSLLIDSAEEEARRLMEVRSRLLRVAEVIPLDSSICLAAAEHQAQHGFSPQDALIYATVLSHLSRWSPSRSCFLNKDSRGFNDPDILAEMAPQGCKLLTRFDHGLQYILRSIA